MPTANSSGSGFEGRDERIFVAVGKERKESESVLLWSLRNFPANGVFVLLHVHCPDKMIPMMGGKFPVSKLSESQVACHRKLEIQNMNKALSQYLEICASMEVQAETLVIEVDDVAKGILSLIHDYRISNLIMGAAAHRSNRRRMRSPTSKKSKIVEEKADPFCRVFFVYKEKLISLRESAINSENQLQERLDSGIHLQPNIWPSAPTENSQCSEISSVYEEASSVVCPSEETENSSFPRVQEDVYSELHQALEEARIAKTEAYEEACRRVKAEKDALEAARRVLVMENRHEIESRRRREVEEALEEVRVENLDTTQELLEVNAQKTSLEAQLAQLKQNLGEAQFRISTLQNENHELRISGAFSVFTFEELNRATRGFDSSLKIGEGGYGTVYKGILRHTAVAIKRLHSNGVHARNEFLSEVEVHRRMRHPNLVTLLGICPEVWCIVYEYLPNGSLEDRLTCKDSSPPLPWTTRLRIMGDICLALIFLHSSQPDSIVHGDLKPANVFLDENFVSKLGDFGLSRTLSYLSSSSSSASSSFLCHRTEAPKGTIEYMDPEILVTGELTVGSDVYSFGVIILRLLTGRQPHRIVRDVQEAITRGAFHEMLDKSAGSWPFVQANQLAYLALQCCSMTHKIRPDLVNGVWRILVPMINIALSSPSPLPQSSSLSYDDAHVPSYFFCPIFQEIMKDPHVAADGYTYEGEAVRSWFEGGNNTSPMTNLALPHQHLIPNHALRSAIHEWLQQQQGRY